jgi:hypothetical protein
MNIAASNQSGSGITPAASMIETALMKCPVCDKSLSPRLKLTNAVMCQSCAQIMLQNMTTQTLVDLKRQCDDAPECEHDHSFAPSLVFRQFRGVL